MKSISKWIEHLVECYVHQGISSSRGSEFYQITKSIRDEAIRECLKIVEQRRQMMERDVETDREGELNIVTELICNRFKFSRNR